MGSNSKAGLLHGLSLKHTPKHLIKKYTRNIAILSNILSNIKNSLAKGILI